jgi:hypothetical protein
LRRTAPTPYGYRTPRSVQLIQPGAAVAVITVPSIGSRRSQHHFRSLPVIVGNSIRLASEVESDRARQRRVREACHLAPRAAQHFVAGDHCAWRQKPAALPGPISRAIQPDLALAGWWASPYLCRKGAIPRERDWTRGQQRGCSPPPKLADTWWSGLGVWRATRSRGALTSMPGSSADAESGPRAEIMRRSGHGDRTHYIRHHHD